ncbi:MAG: hypothetical protein Kow0027_19150 [Saprospiraceae bacterium]
MQAPSPPFVILQVCPKGQTQGDLQLGRAGLCGLPSSRPLVLKIRLRRMTKGASGRQKEWQVAKEA